MAWEAGECLHFFDQLPGNGTDTISVLRQCVWLLLVYYLSIYNYRVLSMVIHGFLASCIYGQVTNSTAGVGLFVWVLDCVLLFSFFEILAFKAFIFEKNR